MLRRVRFLLADLVYGANPLATARDYTEKRVAEIQEPGFGKRELALGILEVAYLERTCTNEVCI
jgi:hypothetical protein